jgi:hypothetical protein
MLNSTFVKLVSWYDNEWGEFFFERRYSQYYNVLKVHCIFFELSVFESRTACTQVYAQFRRCCCDCHNRAASICEASVARVLILYALTNLIFVCI